MSESQDLLKEIATIHGVSVTPDDPLLIIQTLNKRLMEDSAKAQQEMLDRYKEEMEALGKAMDRSGQG